MCSNLHRIAELAVLAGSLSTLPFVAPSSAGPMTPQDAMAVSTQQPLTRIRPLYETGLETSYEAQDWRASHAIGLAGRQETPRGFIASVGRLGVAVNSSRSGEPKIRGLAWSPRESVSFIAGGNLGGGGLGASFSVRLSF